MSMENMKYRQNFCRLSRHVRNTDKIDQVLLNVEAMEKPTFIHEMSSTHKKDRYLAKIRKNFNTPM